MNTAALIFFALSCGINYGWQPMPDDSQRVEYLVQIEPEMLAVLKSGQTIPITSDVPDGVGPIGRVRIVFGQEDLPRQKLITSLKPGSDSRGVAPAQFTSPVGNQQATPPLIDPRNLTTQPAQARPLPGQPAVSADPFARALQDSASRIRHSAGQILSGQETGNGGQSIRRDLTDRRGALGQVGDTVQDATQAVNDRLQQAGQKIRDSADKLLNRSVGDLGNQARETLDQFGQPLHGERSILSDRNPDTFNRYQQSTAGVQRLDEPITPGQVGQWDAGDGRQGTGDRGQSFSRDSTNRRPTAQPFDNQSAVDYRSAGNNPSSPTPRISDNTLRQTSEQSEGRSLFPSFTNNNPTDNPLATDFSNVPGSRSEANTTPTILRDMLTRPAGSPVPVEPQPQDRFSEHNDPVQQGRVQPSDLRSPAAGLQNFPPQQNNRPFAQFPPPSTAKPAEQSEQLPATTGNSNKFLLILAWVLLSGSFAGNVYLFWSYLDVRGKYQAIARSNRFSEA